MNIFSYKISILRTILPPIGLCGPARPHHSSPPQQCPSVPLHFEQLMYDIRHFVKRDFVGVCLFILSAADEERRNYTNYISCAGSTDVESRRFCQLILCTPEQPLCSCDQ